MANSNIVPLSKDEVMRRRTLPIDAKTSEVLLRIYLARRLDYQAGYYEAIIKENEGNFDLIFRFNALILTLASLFAALGTLDDTPSYVRLITALLPSIASLLGAFAQLYQWERQSSLFQDALLGLGRARLSAPDLDGITPDIAYQILPNVVTATEKVFEDEVNQWGQIALGKSAEGEELDKLREFAERYNLDIYDADGNIDEEKAAGLRAMLEAGPQQQKITIQRTETQTITALPASTENTAPAVG